MAYRKQFFGDYFLEKGPRNGSSRLAKRHNFGYGIELDKISSILNVSVCMRNT